MRLIDAGGSRAPNRRHEDDSRAAYLAGTFAVGVGADLRCVPGDRCAGGLAAGSGCASRCVGDRYRRLRNPDDATLGDT